MTQDWAKRTADQIRAKHADVKAENEAALEHSRLRKEQGVRLWSDVRDHIRTKCADINREYGSEVFIFMVVQTQTLDVRYKAPSGKTHTLSASFTPSSADNAIEWRTSGHRMSEPRKGKCELAVRSGTVGLLTGAHPYTPETLAEKMLEDLMAD